MEVPLFDDHIILKKAPGKGGWTYASMPVFSNLPKKRNGTVRVRGFIDTYELKDIHIWVMKKESFLAVKADIRKSIKKEAGDSVKLVLFLDELASVAPNDFILCLREEPKLLGHFQSLPDKRQKEITDWIFAAATEDEKINRMGKTIEQFETEMDQSR